MTISRWDIADYTKAKEALNELLKTDLCEREFTQKEFDKIFKRRGIISLTWLRHHSYNKKSKKVNSYLPYGCGYSSTIPFVELSRIEDFEIPCEKIGLEPEEHKIFVVGKTEIKDIDAKKFTSDKAYAKMCYKAYGDNLEIKVIKKETITGHRNFYKINLDALQNIEINLDKARDYYDEKIRKVSHQLNTYKTCRDMLN